MESRKLMKQTLGKVAVTDWLLFFLLAALSYMYVPEIDFASISVTPFELVGLFGLGICIAAFKIKNDFYLRLCTVVGCAILLVYYAILNVPLAIFGNAAIIYLNVKRLEVMYKNRRLHANMRKLKKYAKEGKIRKITIDAGEPKTDE